MTWIKSLLEMLLKLIWNRKKPEIQDVKVEPEKLVSIPDKPEQANETPWMDILMSHIGTKEIPGEESNPLIDEMLKLADLPKSMIKDETAWCGACARWTFNKAGVKIQTLKNFGAWARAWIHFGVPSKPQYGA